jgi:hypothetical protein
MPERLAPVELARRGRGEIIDLGTKYYILVIARDWVDDISSVFGIIVNFFWII